MPAAVILTWPPDASSALAVMSLSSRATRFSVLMVMLPPVAVPLALVVIVLWSQRMMSLLLFAFSCETSLVFDADVVAVDS